MIVTKPHLPMSLSMTRFVRRASLGSVFGLLALTGCEACDPVDEIIAERAIIAVDVCASPGIDVQPAGGSEDCDLAFGNADISVATERTITITNASRFPLAVRSIEMTGDPSFELIDETPDELGPGIAVPLLVKIRPRLESTITGEIVITSNAGNPVEKVDPTSNSSDGIVRIPITLTGVNNGVPNLRIVPDDNCGSSDPLGVNFGNVATGNVGICNVKIFNDGNRELFFDKIEFVDADGNGTIHAEPADSDEAPAIGIAGTLPTPETPIPVSTDEVTPSLTLRTTFSPDVLGSFSSTLRFTSSDPLNPEIDMPMLGVGVIGPTCVAEIKSVNGVTTAPFDVEPLDDVIITVENSTSASTDVDALANVEWEITRRGGGSTVVLTDPNGIDTGFAFANSRGVDVAGPYEVCAVITDSLGTKSNNPCCIPFEAIPSQSFLVQLTWVNDSGDMDLHVTKGDNDAGYCVDSLNGGSGSVAAPFRENNCSNADCNFATCRVTDTTSPEWDGVAGRTLGDPSLDIDDITGFGPENTNVDVAVAGSYAFGVETYSSSGGPYIAVMKLFLYGRLRGQWQAEISEDFWEVGVVHFPEGDLGNPCVEDLTDGDPDDDCPGF
ncbi:MAG TPA: hypothetical protein VGF99_01680 [Myxococcota bacterium]